MDVESPARSDVELHSLLERLRTLIAPGRATYHAFEWRGRRLLYDLLSGSVVSLDAASLSLLRGIEDGLSADAILERMRADDPGVDADAVVREALKLQELGFFRLEPLETKEQRDQTVAGHTNHHPNKAMVMIQTSCNLKCTYCYEVQSGFHSTGKSMGLDTGILSIENVIERSGRRRDLEITFFGGEPLMNFKLMKELVAYCERRGEETGKRFFFQITTNAVLMTDEVIDFLIEKKFTVMVSLDGKPEKADVNRKDLGGHGVARKAIANAQRLVARQRDAGLREALIRSTMTVENHDSVEIRDFFGEQGFRRVMVGASMGRADSKGPVDLTKEHYPEMERSLEFEIDRYLAWLDGKGSRPVGDPIPRSLERLDKALQSPQPRPSIGCGVGRNMRALTEDGTIYPCHRYAGEKAWSLGNLRDGQDPAKTEEFYRELLGNYDETCSGCYARFVCGGQCPWYLSKADGHVGHPDSPSCDGIRKTLEKHLWTWIELEERRTRRTSAEGARA